MAHRHISRTVCLAGLLWSCDLRADVIHVNPQGTGDYSTIQAAIDAATDGDEVVLAAAQGLYWGAGNTNLDFDGKSITVRSEDPNDPSVVATTIISGRANARGFYFHSGEGPEAVVAGITIRHGYAAGPFGRGGGIYIEDSSPTIRNCVVQFCDVNYLAAGIYCKHSDSLIEGCVIESNESNTVVGGIYCQGGAPRILNSVIRHNRAPAIGGLLLDESSVSIHNSLIVGNTATGSGSSGGESGAIRITGTNNQLVQVDIRHCTIAANSATEIGGGIHCVYHSNITISHCILWENHAPLGAQIAIDDSSSPPLSVTVTVDHSDVQGGLPDVYVGDDNTFVWGDGNIDLEPALYGYYLLAADSPCVDAGDPTLVLADEVDVEGNPRNLDGDGDLEPRVDLGSNEFRRTCMGPGDVDLLVTCMEGPATVVASECLTWDLDDNRIVNLLDTGLLQRKYGPCP